MSTAVSITIIVLFIFFVEWVSALFVYRLNRRASADLAKSLDIQAEMEGHIINLIDDLRGIQPEKDEILEIAALQIRSLHASAVDQKDAMERMSTKLPFWIHLVPLSVAAKRQLSGLREQRARTEKLKEWNERHGSDDEEPR